MMQFVPSSILVPVRLNRVKSSWEDLSVSKFPVEVAIFREYGLVSFTNVKFALIRIASHRTLYFLTHAVPP